VIPVRRIVPCLGLAALGAVVLVAVTSAPPPVASYPEPPPPAALPAPATGLGTATLTGTVLDVAGRPVADAGLVVLYGGRLAWAWSDAEGRFTLRDVPLGSFDVAVVARGFEPSRLATTSGGAPARLVLTRRIDPAPELPTLDALDVQGRVEFSPIESPADGYEVAFLPVLGLHRLDSGFPRRARVAPDGSFEVPALAPGEYEVLLLPPEARGGLWPNLLAGADGSTPIHEQPPVSADPDGRAPIQLPLQSRAGALSGRLSDPRPSGAARWLEGALVRVEPYDGRDGAKDPTRVLWAVSDAEGAWSIRHVPAGNYEVSLTAGAHRPPPVSVRVPEKQGLRIDF
jgi:hypothetical protein